MNRPHRRQASPARLNISGALFYGLTILALLALYAYHEFVSYEHIAILCLAIVYFLTFRSFSFGLSIKDGIKTFINMETMFLINAYIIFFWPYQLDILGLLDLERNTYFSNTYYHRSREALLLSTMGVVAFVAGIRYFGVGSRAADVRAKTAPGDGSIPHFHLATAGLMLGLIALYFVAGLQSAAVGRYTDVNAGGAAADGVYNLITMFSIMAIADFALSFSPRRPDLLKIVSAAIALAWAGYILYYGDRNSFFLIAVAAAGAVFTFRIRGSRVLLLSMLAASMLIYNTIEVFRMSDERSWASFTELLVSGSNERSTRDSSFTITNATVRAAIDIVPAREDFGYGQYQAIGAAGLVPFIRGFVLPEDIKFTDSAQLISYYGLRAGARWNMGTNIISDLYVDFGVAGVILLLLAAGIFAGKLQAMARSRPDSQMIAILYLMALAFFAQYPRYSFMFPLTALVWSTLYMAGLRAIFVSRPRKDDRKPLSRGRGVARG